jgi:hypothetical protein
VSLPYRIEGARDARELPLGIPLYYSPVQSYTALVWVDDLGIAHAKDGSTGRIIAEGSDHASVIQAAIDSLDAGIVLVRKGTYNVARPILLKPWVQLVGEGYAATVLRAAADMDYVVKITADAGGGIEYSGVRNLRVHGNRDYYTAGGILVKNCWDVFVDADVFATKGNAAVRVEGNPWASFIFSDHLNIHDFSGRGLEIFGEVNGVHISRCMIRYGTGSTSGCEPMYIGDLPGTAHSPWQIQIDWLETENNNFTHRIDGGNTRMRIGFWYGDTDHQVYIPSTGQIEIDYLYYGFKVSQLGLNIDSGAYVTGKAWLLGYAANVTPSTALHLDGGSVLDLDYLYFWNGSIDVVTGSTLRSRSGNKLTINSGVATFSGDESTTQFAIPHGLIWTPTRILVTPGSSDAQGTFHVTADEQNIYVNYASPPPAGTNNVVLYWYAEF